MSISERIGNTLEDWSSRWKDRLGGWLLGVIGSGITSFTEELEPEVKDSARIYLAELLANPAVPDDLKLKIRSASAAGNILEVIYLEAIMILQSIGVILGGSTPIANELRYAQDYLKRSSRLDPLSVITAWRRDRETYERYFEDLREQGWSEDRIEALKFVTMFYPAPADLVTWQAREVFEPTMVEKYGLDDEFEGIEKEPFYKAGMSDEQILNYWRAHWEHASFNQIVEMLRRGLITEQDVYEWYKVVEIVPYWRDKLTAITWEVPTRVDVRRFWEYGTIDETRLREIYSSQGYHGKDLDDYVLWTKVYTAFPDLITRYKNGWLSLEDVKAELLRAGMTEEKAEELIQTKVKAAASEKLAPEKDLTMSQIVKGVKKDVITRSQGALLLQEMGYDQYEADYILAIEIPQDQVDSVVSNRELSKTDILNGLKTGVITEEEARQRLLELRYRPVDADFILDIYRATANPPEEPREREASKADIVKAVKKGLITPEDGYLMLQDIGFSPEASEFILMVQAEESPFSPMSFSEFEELTGLYRRVSGIGGRAMPEEIRKIADQLVQLSNDRDRIREELERREFNIVEEEALPAEERAELTTLRTTLLRTEAELERLKAEYERQVAVWRREG